MFLVGAEDVLDQELVLGQPLPGDGHQFRERQSVSTTHRMQLRILTTAVCVCVCVGIVREVYNDIRQDSGYVYTIRFFVLSHSLG